MSTKRSSQPSHHKASAAPFVIWSNSAYGGPADDDDRLSVGSNGTPPLPRTDRDQCLMVMCDEEIRLREELGREIEKELERELMEGIRVLVRRLSDLKAKQFLREISDTRSFLRSDDQSKRLKKKKKKCDGKRRDDYRSDAESMTAPPPPEVKKYGRDWRWR